VVGPLGFVPDRCQDLAVKIYGRDELIDRLARSRAPVTVLSGDSAVGKSTVLAAAQEASVGTVSPSPRTVARAGGILQRALLEALADALVELTAESELRAIGRTLTDAAKRLAEDRAQQLIKVLGAELLNFARAKLGPEVGNALADYVAELKTAADESLAARISAAIDPDVAALVVDLAAEVAKQAGGRPVLLALDAGERLHEADLNLLADIAETLPESVRVRLAISTYTAELGSRVERLEASGSAVYRLDVPPISPEAVIEWLLDEDLDPGLAEMLERETGGYALHLDDAIDHLKDGGALGDMPRSQAFEARTREAWEGLAQENKLRVRNLCVFGDPPGTNRLHELLDLDSAAVGQLEEDLIHARIFSVEVNGRPWFHEQRRLFVVERILKEDERAEASARAIGLLMDWDRADDSFDRMPEIARLLPDASGLLAEDEQLADAIAIDRDELALAAGLIELIERDSPAVLADALLRYVRATFGGDQLIAAIERLAERSFVAVVKQDDAAAVVPYWREPLVKVAIIGRAFNELGRMPVPAVASSVFGQEVIPRIGRFEKGHYGVGSASLARLGELIPELRQPSGGMIVIGAGPGENLLLRGSFAGRPLYGSFTFDDAVRRDEARDALTGLATEIFGERLALTDVLPHPGPLIPSNRFLGAAERILGRRFCVGRPSLELPEPLAPPEALRRRAEALRIIRSRCTSAEQGALELEEPVAFLWRQDDDLDGHHVFHEVEVRGGREGAFEIPGQLDFDWQSPYGNFSLETQLELPDGERAASQRVHMGARPDGADPVIDLIAMLRDRAMRYNRAQLTREVLMLDDEESLSARFTTAARRTLADAQALSAIPLGSDPSRIEPRVTYLAVFLRAQHQDMVFDGSALHASLPSPDGEESVRVKVISPPAGGRLALPPDTVSPGARLMEIFDLTVEPQQFGRGEMSLVLSRLLGFSHEELQIEHP